MSELSIRLKLVALTGFFFVVLLAILIVLSTRSINSVSQFATEELSIVQQTQAESLLRSAAETAQAQVENYLGNTSSIVTSFAKILTETAVNNGGQPFSRDRVREITLHFLQSSPNMNALYAQFDPNGYDGNDAQNVGNETHSSDIGTLDVYWVLEEGEYNFYATDSSEKMLSDVDEYGIREAEWYLCSKDSRQACLLDPYLYEITEDNSVLMTTYSEPVLSNGRFLGMVGADINIPAIQEQLISLSAQLFGGAGHVTIVSERGLIVGSSAEPESAGQSLAESEFNFSLGAQGLEKGGVEWVYSTPFTIGNASENWQVFVTVPTAVLLAAAQKLEVELSKETRSTVSSVLMAALVLVVIGLGLVFWAVNSIAAPLRDIALRMEALSSNDGDLTQRLADQKHLELILLAKGFNRFTNKLREMILSLMRQRDVVTQTNIEFSHATIIANEATSRQAEQVHSVVAAVTQMSSSALEVASLATQNGDAAREISTYLQDTFLIVEVNKNQVESLAKQLVDASDQVGKVSQSSDSIYSILDTIRAIAEQTNLLALNAAIEAARAGEQGRGFAVVADEVRNLAARTQQSTQEVDELIKGLQVDVQSAVSLIQSSQQSAEETVLSSIESAEKLAIVNERVASISDNTLQVATAANEQSAVAEEINQSLIMIGDSATDLSDIIEDLKANNANSIKAVDELTSVLSLLKV